MNGNQPKVYSVVELTRTIKDLLEGEVGSVWVEGEVSNLRQPSSGHCYFTIKDEYAQIAAVLFRGDQRLVKCALRDGIRARVFGDVTVYERNGNYQIIVRRAEEAGKGALQARFEELKEKLRKEGLFAEERKKPIPLLPQHVGVVTSPTGAAIRDILHVVTRRFPNLHVVLAPVKVQGEGAAGEIAEALDLLNRRGGLDVIIAGRGGGSLEDLWCFNEEIVARAIARSAIPVISAVGHETDFTISDFVADLRAPTPSAAAELVVGRKEDFEEHLRDLARHIGRLLKGMVLEARTRVLTAGGSPVFGEPRNVVSGYAQRVEGLGLRAAHCVEGCVRDRRQSVDDLGLRLLHEARIWRQSCQQEIRRLETQFRALNPLAVLDRGYSITSGEDGRALRSAAGVRVGQRVVTRLARGRLLSDVTSKSE